MEKRLPVTPVRRGAAVPRQSHVDVTRNEQVLLTVEDLDRSLIASGLPPTRQVFGLDFRGDPVEDATEAELVGEESPPK